MKKINKNINIAMIFMLIGVFLCQGITCASDFLLRLPIGTKNPDFTKRMSHLEIRQRHEELRKRFGGKAAWLIILKELGLPEKLGFEIPSFVCFERKEAKAIYDKYESEDIRGILIRFNREVGLLEVEYSLMKLYRVDTARADLKKQLALLFDEKFKPLLEYASKEKWIDFFTSLRLSPSLRRLINNHKQKYPYLEYRINRDAVDYLMQAIKSFLLLNTFSLEEKNALLRKIENLPLRMIIRSSGFKEDSFETSMAGAYISEIVDQFNWLWGVAIVMSPNNTINTITDDFVDTDYTILIQEYVPAEKAGIVFSNLSGYTTIECVVGDGSTAVAGWNNTIIDLDQDGRIEEINQGCYKGEIRSISWDGFKLDFTDALVYRSIVEKTIRKIRDDNMVSVKDMNGKYNDSSFSENEIQFTRKVALGIEEAVGFPVDLELNFKGKTLNMIQMRPIVGENSSLPKKLPEFRKEDIVAKVPISIGSTSEEGFTGYILSFMTYEDEKQFIKNNGILEQIGLKLDDVIIVSASPILFRDYKVIIDSDKSSRIYHHGIDFRERGMVVGGVPGIIYRSIPALKWKDVRVNINGEIIHLRISAEKVKYFSNNFRGVLVKAGALPLASMETVIGSSSAARTKL